MTTSEANGSAVGALLERRGFAYRVLGAVKRSPGAGLGFIPWFDFIVRAEGLDLVAQSSDGRDTDAFAAEVAKAEGQPLKLTLFNSKNCTLRSVSLTPNREWRASGKPQPTSSAAGLAALTGLKLAFDTYMDAHEHVVHVLDVQKGSPAQLAGLQSNTDFLLGSSDGLPFRGSAALVGLVRRNAGKEVRLYVYSSVADTVRIARLTPSNDWPGNGMLGCDIGVGQSHRLPADAMDSLGMFRPTSSKVLANMDSDLKGAMDEFRPTPRPRTARPVKHQVKTAHGFGQVHGRDKDGAMIVELDWKLPNGAAVVFFAQAQSCEPIPSL